MQSPDINQDKASESMATALSPIEDILADFRAGKMVILVDDEDRENEGDLVVAAEHASPEVVNFMARYGRGLICLTLTSARCQQLGLSLMVGNNNARYSTNFTVSIEAAEGVTTGISAADRATTVRAAVKPDATAQDIISPGHIFPLQALPGGVLTRAGHTEAGVDLARLAGFHPASVICEILKEDGSMARLPDLLEFARQHDLKVGGIADLIRYRLNNEPTVSRVGESRLVTGDHEFRVYAYHDVVDDEVHLALVLGQVRHADPVMVRVHVETGLYDLLVNLKYRPTWPVDKAIQRICKEGHGILVLLRYNESGEELVKRFRHSQIMDKGIEFPWQEPGGDLRMLGVGGQILADLGVGKMRVLGTPKKAHGLSGFDLEIVEYISSSD